MKTKLLLAFAFLMLTATSHAQDSGSIQMECPPSVFIENCFETIGVPPNLSYNDFIAQGGSITSDCGVVEESFELVFQDSIYMDFGRVVYFREYSIMDTCGNVAYCFHEIDQPYLFAIPEDIFSGNHCGTAEDIMELTGLPYSPYHSFLPKELFVEIGGDTSDFCDPFFYDQIEIEYFDHQVGGTEQCSNMYTRTFHFYSFDESYDKVMTQTLELFDNYKPTVKNADTIVVYNEDHVPYYDSFEDFVAAGGNATDNCELDDSRFSYSGTITEGECPKIKTVLYAVFDKCGHVTLANQVVIVRDTTPPVFYNMNDVVLQCYSEIPPAATSLDDFDNNVWASGHLLEGSFKLREETVQGSCPLVISRTYEISDLCGNIGTHTQTITVNDTEKPVLMLPLVDTVLSCNTPVPDAYSSYSDFVAAGGTANDNCILMEHSFRLQNEVIDEESCIKEIYRTYEIIDTCGNVATASHVFTFYDENPPVVLAPEDTTITCSWDVPPAFSTTDEFMAAGGMVTDNCSSLEELTIGLVNTTTQGTCQKVIEREYQVIDFCGNSTSFIHTIQVIDTIEPAFEGVPNLSFQCMADVPVPYDYYSFTAAGGEFWDNCAVNHKIDIFVGESQEGTCPAIIKRIYQVKDSCGNVGTWEHIITVQDTIPPVFQQASAITVECSSAMPQPFSNFGAFSAAGGSASDNCEVDTANFQLINSVTSGSCPTTITRTYQVSDFCGNIVTCEHVITVIDTTPPTLATPSQINDIEFGSNLPDFETLDSHDNCGTLLVTTSKFPYTVDENGYNITYVWTASDDCGNSSQVSTTFSVLPKPTEYCIPAISATSEWIANVSIGNQSNSSSGNGYGDYSSQFTFNLTAANTSTISLAPGFARKATFEYWAVWIDFNVDGIFADDEKIFAANKKRSTVSGEITIPDVATLETRMRVIMSRDGAPVSCPESGNGEVEDYAVTITGAVPQAPVAAFTSDKNLVTVGGSIQFNDNSSNNPTTWNWTFDGGEPASSTSQNPLVTYGSTGTFDVTLVVSNNNGSDTYTAQIEVNDEPAPAYCESKSLSTSKEWIANVAVGSFSNNSGAAVYSDFTDQSLTLAVGASEAISLAPGFGRKSQREFWKVWIDFNQDSDFDDAGEEVFSYGNAKAAVSGNIYVPADALTGSMRMRVAMKATAFSTACETFERGEVEDYSVEIVSTKSALVSINNRNEAEELLVYPNPVTAILKVKYSAYQNSTVSIYNLNGSQVLREELVSAIHEIEVSNLAPGSYYLLIEHETEVKTVKFIKQ